MRKTYTHKGITWIDLENPTLDEARQLISTYGIDPLVADELLSPTVRSRVDLHKNFIYLILHFPALSTKRTLHFEKRVQEIDFIIGKDFIITTHYDTLDSMHDFSRIFEVNSILDHSDMSEHGGYVFFYMIQHFYKELMDKIDDIRETLQEVEDHIFSGKESKMVLELSRLNRLLLANKEAIALHKEVLESFEIAGLEFFGKEFKYHLRRIIGEYYKVNSATESTRDYLHELRDTNDSLLSTKQNEIMKNLTVVNFVFLPLALIAGIFGMKAAYIPTFISQKYDFIAILSLMVILSVSMVIYFKGKKWL